MISHVEYSFFISIPDFSTYLGMQHGMIGDPIEVIEVIVGTIDLAVEGRLVEVTLPSHLFLVFLHLHVLLLLFLALVLSLHVVLVLDEYRLRVYPPCTT